MLLFITVLCTSTKILKQMIENLHARVQVGWKILLALRKKVHAFVQVRMCKIEHCTHQGLINFFTEMTKRRITSSNFIRKFIGANCFMENLEIKCSQLCFDTTIKIIFMNDILQSTSSSTFKASHQNFSVSLGLE